MIKAILFDFGQTLVNSADGFRAAEKEAQKKVFPDLGMTSREDFLSNYRRIRKAFHEKSNFSRKDIMQEIYRFYHLQPDLSLLEKWESEYWKRVTAHTTLFPETEQVLENLAPNYRVALITNTQGQTIEGKHRLSQFPELEKYFETIIVAGESGVPPKPDPLPFNLCLEAIKIAPNEAVYVGDDWRIDICGARQAGIKPIWLQHHRVHRNWPQVKTSVPIISSLKQLLNIKLIYDDK